MIVMVAGAVNVAPFAGLVIEHAGTTFAGAFTVNVATLDVALPALFATTTLNCEPLSPITVAGVVYVATVAPEIFTAFFRH
ncbi:membrane protein [sediment metagenome]|uniref:Membrane protein n=1 Tax=sediment metagenome TaxID=749907 RepID=D9PM79_9ZZZZ